MSIRYTYSVVASARPRSTGALDSAAAPAPQAAAAQTRIMDTSQFKSYHDGTVERVRIGAQTDGSFGIKIYNSAGALVHTYTTT